MPEHVPKPGLDILGCHRKNSCADLSKITREHSHIVIAATGFDEVWQGVTYASIRGNGFERRPREDLRRSSLQRIYGNHAMVECVQAASCSQLHTR